MTTLSGRIIILHRQPQTELSDENGTVEIHVSRVHEFIGEDAGSDVRTLLLLLEYANLTTKITCISST